jgi:hypothetical protein
MAISLASLNRTTALKPPRILIHGVHGVGKTTFAAGAPDPVFLLTEDGLGTLDVPHFPLARTFDEVMQGLAALYTEDHGFRTLVVDSVDWLEPLIHAKVCRDRSASSATIRPRCRIHERELHGAARRPPGRQRVSGPADHARHQEARAVQGRRVARLPRLDQTRRASDLGARAHRLERLARRRHRHPDRHRDRRRHRHPGREAREPAGAAGARGAR